MRPTSRSTPAQLLRPAGLLAGADHAGRAGSTRPPDDFRLKRRTRPAIDAGSAQYAPARDRDGKLRDRPPDVGAYER